MSVESIVVAIDGDAKCGKTFVINTIAAEAQFQDGIIPDLLGSSKVDDFSLKEEDIARLQALHDHYKFNDISVVTAGNTFRAATLHVALLELEGRAKKSFEPDDVEVLKELLSIDGIDEVLQTDPNIVSRVATVSKMAGVQTVCSTILCDFISEAYGSNGGGNLLIADARDPVGHLKRNDRIGSRPGQIDPAMILPIYIDTPAEVAASRMSGDYATNLAEINTRRFLDATRDELPVTRPAQLIEAFDAWIKQYVSEADLKMIPAYARKHFKVGMPKNGIALHLRLYNGADVDRSNVQYIAGHIAMFANDLAITRHLVEIN